MGLVLILLYGISNNKLMKCIEYFDIKYQKYITWFNMST